MTIIELNRERLNRVMTAQRRYVPIFATAGLFLIMFAIGSGRYTGFLSGQVVLNLLIDNAFLLVVAVGMTFVIMTGGIDLSVGSMIALSTMICAWLVQQHGWPPYLVMPIALAVGALFGFVMGCIIHYFEIQPFIVTLAGMFLARGLCYTMSINSISIDDPVFTRLAQTRIPLGDVFISPSVLIALAVLLVAFYVLHYRRLGRNVYAIGGNEQSALLMGLPVARTKIAVYTISGFCSALGGVLFTFYTLSGYGLNAVGVELDAIAAVVIGGTLLTGGSGYVLGTLLGVLVLGVIQTIITFEGTLSSWWTRIVVGVLLFVFIVLQRAVAAGQPESGTRQAARAGPALVAGDGAPKA
jgi:simple sugar transport system permease protein